ncbi:MAG: response regulator [Elusimicrobia bacterium]|jgi:CheY-like chemotaxis protein|nr:response regulator [Elusimicrobiota bacterium]
MTTDPVKVIDLKSVSRPKILVAEDEKDIASLIEDWLSEIYDVTVAFDGKTAVQKAVWHQPQVILLDVVLPDMSGYDVVRQFQGASQTRGIPVIVMTAKNFDDSTIKLIKLESNVFGFLNKPFKPSDLIKMLEVVLKGGRSLGLGGAPLPTPVPQSPERKSEKSSGGGAMGGAGSPGQEPPIEPIPETPIPGEPIPAPVREAIDPVPEEKKERVRDQQPTRSHRKSLPLEEKGNNPVSVVRAGLFKWVGLLCLAIFFLILALLGVGEWTCRRSEQELGVRFFTPPLFPASRFNSFMPYQWNDPGNTSPTVWNDGDVVYPINQWGLRGPDVTLVAPNGVRRILLLGGTSTFGPGVVESATLARRLESFLNEDRPGGYQVINGGLWALSPAEQWAFVKGQGLNFKPDTILWLCENRPPGVPSTEGLRWLANRRWLVKPPFSTSRFLQMLVQIKIRGEGDPVLKVGDPLLLAADKLAKDQKIFFRYWIVPRENLSTKGRRVGSELSWILGDGPPVLNTTVVERLARAVEKKSE